MNMIEVKARQAVSILKEKNIDMWLTFVRESSAMPDPAIDMVVGQHATWQTAWIICKDGETIAVAGSLDIASIEDNPAYTTVVPYVQGIRESLLDVLKRKKPKKIAINYSTDSVMSDGLTHGMYLLLTSMLEGTPYAKRLVSSQDVISALRGRKTSEEIRHMRKAIKLTLDIYNDVTGYLRPGRTEQDVANFILRRVRKEGVELAWDQDHCPAVFTGPEHAGAHYGPTTRKIQAGHVLNIDFGVKINGYCSDLQRTWYIRRKGETRAPKEVQHGFNVIRDSIRLAADAMKPGMLSWKIDQVARKYITDHGYPEYPHALGHQVGRAAHDGGVGLLPRWERYGKLPYGRIEEGQVFTIEPRLPIEGFGVATIEEIVWVTSDGVKFLSAPQRSLYLV
ncbi:MAG: aminopeptidase P family protein [Ignavibacteria bacterium]|nr:MAG: aminopeptidase P family protein [Ignavibacteria bacterium]